MRRAIDQGANRFYSKAQIVDALPMILSRLSLLKGAKQDIAKSLIGDSFPMQRLRDEILLYRLECPWDLWIEGETGSGKELVARALHNEGPFVAVNTAAIPPELFEAEFFGAEKGAFTGANQTRMGLLEQAGTGTLFLDEIQSMSLEHQAKLLRVLETRSYRRVGSTLDRSFRARVVAASNRPLTVLQDRGVFREDLGYRFSVQVRVPPLRDRLDDLPGLVEAFMQELDFRPRPEWTPEAWEFLKERTWPGNVRELKAFVKQLSLKLRVPKIGVQELSALEPRDLKDHSSKSPPSSSKLDVSGSQPLNSTHRSLKDQMEELEDQIIQQTLSRCGGAVERAAAELQVSRSWLYAKVKKIKDSNS
jgi:DNA-binding NtrC family response regulator